MYRSIGTDNFHFEFIDWDKNNEKSFNIKGFEVDEGLYIKESQLDELISLLLKGKELFKG